MTGDKNYDELHEPVQLLKINDLKDREPEHAKVNKTDLVVVAYDTKVSVLYGRCLHRGAMMSDGYVDGDNLICGLHSWDYRIDTGVSEYNPKEILHKFSTAIFNGHVWIDREEIEKFEQTNPSPFKSDEYLGDFQDTHPENTETLYAVYKGIGSKWAKKMSAIMEELLPWV